MARLPCERTNRILDDFEDSPSLRRHLQEDLEHIYTLAAQDAKREMNLPASRATEIPVRCPYTLNELLDGTPEESC